jgi:hypothetical protein
VSGYDDIIHLPHHRSSKHPPMPQADRAAQFSPFAALTGYDAAVKETARLTDQRIELDEDEKAALDETLRALVQRIDQRPQVRLTYFRPDEKKDGGAYVTAAGKLKRVDALTRTLLLEDGRKIPMDSVISVEP